MNNLTTVIKTMRPPFLILVLSCLALSYGFLTYQQIDGNLWLYVLILLTGISAHIAVNMLNEYKDFESRLDFSTEKTPFSGGSGALVQNGSSAVWVKYYGQFFVFLTLLSGLSILALSPSVWISLLLLGVLGFALVITYTPTLNRHPWMCLVAPGLGFGVVMSYGAYVAVSNGHNLYMLALCLIPTLLTNNLLLINQFPDAKVDAQHGRNHVLIKYGMSFGATLYAIQWGVAVVLTAASILALELPAYSLVCLVPLLLGLNVYRQARQYAQTSPSFLAAMGQNVIMTLLTPLLLGVILCVAA